ncbi:MAG: hypothetical protein OSB62_03330 [Alphaproteobacteria bacterium]|nr:hypothetical protein [Alphaproteobacteria bacterium]
MPDLKKFLQTLGMGEKTTFKGVRQTVKFDKQSNPVKATPQKPVAHSENRSFDAFRSTATNSFAATNTPKKPLLSQVTDMLKKAQTASIKTYDSTRQYIQERAQSMRKEHAGPALSESVQGAEHSQAAFSTQRTVSPEQASNVDLSNIPSRIHLSEKPDQELNVAEKENNQEVPQAGVEQPKRKGLLGRMLQRYSDSQMRRAYVAFDMAGTRDRLSNHKTQQDQLKTEKATETVHDLNNAVETATVEAHPHEDAQEKHENTIAPEAARQAEINEKVAQIKEAIERHENQQVASNDRPQKHSKLDQAFDDMLKDAREARSQEQDVEKSQHQPTPETSELSAVIARTREFAQKHTKELEAKEAASPDMVPDETHTFEGTLHEADPSSIVNHPEPEEPKRPQGKGTKYMGGAHVETLPGHTANNPDKSLNDAWAAEARRMYAEDAVEAARQAEQLRKESAYSEELEAETPKQQPER